MDRELEALIIRKTLRVPLPGGSEGNGAAVTRQLDSVLLGAGFKLSGALMERLSGMRSDEVLDLGTRVLAVVREMAGDHVEHNSYFKNFPSGVPDTVEFWLSSLHAALLDPVAAENVEAGYIRVPASGADMDHDGEDDNGGGKIVLGWVNLLSLPNYGAYQHTYEDMLAAHEEMIPAVSDRVTVLHAGGTLDEEASALYLSLAGSTVPLSPEDLASLAGLAMHCLSAPAPEKIPVRENRAVINRVRLAARKPLLADTVTDVLRLVCAASDGDVTLEKPTKYRSFARPERRLILAALQEIVHGNPARLGDVAARGEAWKRLAERLHPHEYPQYPGAADVFAVARGEKRVPSFAGRVETTMTTSGAGATAKLLGNAPGLLWRSLDRLLRSDSADVDAITFHAVQTAPDVSSRVLLSVREHLANRQVLTDVSRVFANRGGKAWVRPDQRVPLPAEAVAAIADVVDSHITRRLPDYGTVLVDPAILDVALPLSGKAVAPGLGMLPRGSVSLVDGETLRFFVYWKQRQHRTDYDLSALLLDGSFGNAQHVSWTSYHAGGYATYSGDITDARDGATEFIDVVLPRTPSKVIIPQVHLYCGERFDEVQEAFFGFMVRSQHQEGAPFEARTVRMKSDLRGAGRVALPLAFIRGDDGRWRAKWLHLYLRGRPQFNLTEGNRVTTTILTRAIVERDYLRVRYLTRLMEMRGDEVRRFDGTVPEEPVTFIGLEQPDGLPEGSRVITPPNLSEVIPA